MNDIIFTQCTIKEFMEKGNNTLKNVQICICDIPKMVEEEKEKQQILETYHYDPLFGGHVGNNRLLEKLRANCDVF